MTATLSDRHHRTRARRPGWWWWFTLTALAVAVAAVTPYLTDSLRGLSTNGSELARNYVDRSGLIQVAFYLHVGFGGLALLLSPLQFAARLRAAAPKVHRVIGATTLTSIGIGGVAGAVLSTTNLAGGIGTAGFGSLSMLWIGCAGMVIRSALAGDRAGHRRWAIRTFALTYAAVTLRLWLPILIALQAGIGGVAVETAFHNAYLIVPFLCWLPNLAVAEMVLRRTSGVSRSSRSSRSGKPAQGVALR